MISLADAALLSLTAFCAFSLAVTSPFTATHTDYTHTHWPQ